MTKRLWAPEGEQVSSMMNRNRSGPGATTRSTGDTPVELGKRPFQN